jgi:hypothetical protein
LWVVETSTSPDAEQRFEIFYDSQFIKANRSDARQLCLFPVLLSCVTESGFVLRSPQKTNWEYRQSVGHPLDLIVVRKGSADEISSGLQQRVSREVSSLPGIAKEEKWPGVMLGGTGHHPYEASTK